MANGLEVKNNLDRSTTRDPDAVAMVRSSAVTGVWLSSSVRGLSNNVAFPEQWAQNGPHGI
jgi:hypothetical protein